MRSYSPNREGDDVNPYIALADIAISTILVVVVFFALDRLGMVNFRYKKSMQDFAQAVNNLPQAVRPKPQQGRHDPPGVQRWVFANRDLFLPLDPIHPDAPPQLTPGGKRALDGFARLLRQYHSKWQRIRVEGHTKPPQQNGPDNWDLSSRRAAAALQELETGGHISPWYFAVAGRAGQNPLHAVYVCCRPGSPSAAWAEKYLASKHVTFTEKDLGKDLTHDSAVKDSLPKIVRDGTPYFVEVNDDGGSIAFPAPADLRDDKRLNDLIQQFGRNERVEVCIEYTSKANARTGLQGLTLSKK